MGLYKARKRCYFRDVLYDEDAVVVLSDDPEPNPNWFERLDESAVPATGMPAQRMTADEKRKRDAENTLKGIADKKLREDKKLEEDHARRATEKKADDERIRSGGKITSGPVI
jgi:hypothetical protein